MGVTVGTTERADDHNVSVAKADKEIHKLVQETAILAWAACVDLHVTDWVTSQQEDPILKTTIKWISGQKVQDLKHLLGDDTNTEEGKTILWEQKKLMICQGALYHCHTPAGKLEEVLWFVVPKAHWVAAMNGCHWDSGHQGQQQMLCLLHDWFRWPGMATQMQKAVSSASDASNMKAFVPKPQCDPSLSLLLLELLHIDFTSIETMMEFNQPPNMVNIFVFCDHFTKQVMAHVIPNQTAKTVAKFLWQGYILIFCALAKLLRYQGANFESNIISELCELISKWKVRTLPYHAQTNGQVEWAHKMPMCMIGKLGRDQKADWPNHLPALVHAYNWTRLAITGYSPHYLMYRYQPCLTIDFYFPMIRGMRKHQHVDQYIAELHEWLWEAFKEA